MASTTRSSHARQLGDRPLPSTLAAIFSCSVLLLLGVDIVETWVEGLPLLHVIDILECVSLVAANAALWRVVRLTGTGTGASIAWRLLLGGTLTYLVGEIAFTTLRYVSTKAVIFPSIADLFFVGGQVMILAALVLHLVAYASTGLPLGGAGSYILMYSGVAAISVYLVRGVTIPMWADDSLSYGWKLLTTVYNILDLLTFCSALALLRVAELFRGGALAQGWAAVAFSFVFMMAGDTLFGIDVDEKYVSFAFLASYSSLIFGALRHSELIESVG